MTNSCVLLNYRSYLAKVGLFGEILYFRLFKYPLVNFNFSFFFLFQVRRFSLFPEIVNIVSKILILSNMNVLLGEFLILLQ